MDILRKLFADAKVVSLMHGMIIWTETNSLGLQPKDVFHSLADNVKHMHRHSISYDFIML